MIQHAGFLRILKCIFGSSWIDKIINVWKVKILEWFASIEDQLPKFDCTGDVY